MVWKAKEQRVWSGISHYLQLRNKGLEWNFALPTTTQQAMGLRAMVWKAKEQRVWSGISHYLQLHSKGLEWNFALPTTAQQGLGVEFRTTYNYTTINLWWIWASQGRANVLLTWNISRWAKGARNWSWCGIWLLISKQPGRRSRFGPGVGP
jgi:hypothetical protein